MSEYRPVLNPDILDRLTASIETIKPAWQADVARLRTAEDRLAFTERELILANERVESLRADIAEKRVENSGLIRRNAHLEAQLGRVYDNSMDAAESLRNLSSRAVEAARTAPPAGAASRWKDPEKKPPGDDDGTNLPSETPLIFRRPGPTVDRLPINEYGRHAAE